MDFVEGYYRKSDISTTLSSAVTHARASDATYVDSSGVIQTATSNVARVGHHIYNGTSWVNEGILHESEARTNSLTYSNIFDGTGKFSPNAGLNTIVNNAAETNSGLSFSELEIATAKTSAEVNTNITLTASTQYTFSVYVKAFVGTPTFQFTINSFGFAVSGTLNLATGAWTTDPAADAQGDSSSIEDFGGGVYRVSMTFTLATDTLGKLIIRATSGTAGDSILIAGAQVEAGATPSSYIATAGATATRAAETLTVPTANLPYDSTNMSIQMDGKVTGASSTFADWTLDASNGILMQSGVADFTFTQEAVGTVDTVTGGSYTSGLNVDFNIASRNGSTFINGAVVGTALTADTTPTALPDLSATDFLLGSDFMGTIGKLRVWSDDLADVGIEEAST